MYLYSIFKLFDLTNNNYKIFNINEQTQKFIRQHIDDDSHLLALAAKQNPEINISFALNQIAAHQQAKQKIPSWYLNDKLVFPPKISMEQCSSEATARYKANLCKGENFADLTGGSGIDFSFMSQNFKRSFYVEKDEYLSKLAKYNFDVLALKNIEIINCSSNIFLEDSVNFDWIYIDPSRRNVNNKKEILIENCSPDILKIKNIILKKSKNTLIKLSPVFDLVELQRKLSNITQIHVVAVKNECKELLVKMEQNCDNNIEIVCVNINDSGKQIFSFNPANEKKIEYDFVQNVQKYLYEPNVAIQKSGGFKSIAQRFGLKAINANSKIYTSDTYITDFYGRIFIVEDVVSFNKTELKTNLKNIKKANITVRNFPLSVADLRKKLNIDEGGDIYLFATTIFNGGKVIIKCRKDI
ncbi:MAG: class I SAM-dependent methyltransferase [Prevotellaceae bacterium]|nr:class I SAM-dependent methyltransferase [Prevotellaceae bacterium]